MIDRRTELREVQLLRYLLDQYRQDVSESTGEGHRFVYFIDAHELYAFVEGSSKHVLDGFGLKAEWALAGSAGFERVESEIRFKSEAALRWLLFDQPDPVILLPPHGKEMNERIRILARDRTSEALGLVETARSQIEFYRNHILSSQLMFAMITSAEQGDEDSKTSILEFLTRNAPAVITLLRVLSDHKRERVKLLMERSKLITLDGVEWEAYGLDSALSDRIRALMPDDKHHELASRWEHRLSQERGNTDDSNRRDASAIAYLVRLSDLLLASQSHVRPVLVTRALTVNNAVRYADVAREHAGIARHSRMVTIPSGAALTPPSTEPVHASDAALKSLSLVLDTYEKQLEALPLGGSVPEKELKSMVTAWHQFEGGVYTINLANSPQNTKEAEDKIKKDEEFSALLRWLKTEDNVETLLMKHLDKDIEVFESAVFASQTDTSETLPAQIRPARNASRVRVQPLRTPEFGPVELDARFFESYPKEAVELELQGILSRPCPDAAENFLAWSLTHCMQRSWSLAGIYADHASKRARLFHQGATREEAILLFAQITRTEVARKTDDERRELERSLKLLRECKRSNSDPRFVTELTRLSLEIALHSNANRAGLSRLYIDCTTRMKPVIESDADRHEMLGMAESMLLILLAIDQAEGCAPDMGFDIVEEVGGWYASLQRLLSQLREEGPADGLSSLTNAVELLAGEFERTSAPEGPKSGRMLEGAVASRPLIHETQEDLALRKDKTSHFVATAIARMIDQMGKYNLVYAPIWDRSEVDRAARQIGDPEIQEAAITANRLVQEIGDRQSLFDGDRRDAEKLHEALALLDQVIARPDAATGLALYHVCMQQCYAQLLAALIEPNETIRLESLQTLLSRYEALLQRYPNSAVLHYRRGMVLSELGLRDESLAAMTTARDALKRDKSTGERHWIARTIRRRIGVHFSAAAADDKALFRANPEDGALRRNYLKNIEEAFKSVYEGFDEEVEAKSYRRLFETERTLNNIVYYASWYLKEGGELESLATGFSRSRLLDMTKRLHQASIAKPAKWSYVHTVGSAYHALGMVKESLAAADRLWNLLSSSGENTGEPGVRNALDDALAWKRKGAAFESA